MPGAVATILGLAGLRVFSGLVFEPLVASNAVSYGALGTVLIMQSWLIGVGWVIYGGQLFGRWFYDAWLQAWARSRWGHTPIAGADVEAMAGAAGRGYHADTLVRRRPGGGWPAPGSAAAGAGPVRLDPELDRALLTRAAEEHVSVSEVVHRAIGEYLRAS